MIFGLDAYAPDFVLLVVAGIFVAFVWERFSPDVVAVTGVALLLGTRVLTVNDFLSVFGNSAPITIACMFIISGALMRTGAIEMVGELLIGLVERAPALGVVAILLIVMAASAFINNTPVVIVLIPVIVRLATTLGQRPSKLLIPLSYATILGGTCTLIGTSTNLLVDGIARVQGLAPFGMFEITAPGFIMGLVGLVYLALIGRHLLPERDTLAQILSETRKQRFLTEVVIPEASSMIGRRLLDLRSFQRADSRIIDVMRRGISLRRRLQDVVIEAGDRIFLTTSVGEVMSLREEDTVSVRSQPSFDPLPPRDLSVVEAIVGPSSPLAGHSVGALRLRRRFGVILLAIHRHNQNLGANLDDVVLAVGDSVLLEGTTEDVRRFYEEQGLINLMAPRVPGFRRRKVPVVLAVVTAIMGLAAVGAMPILGLAVIGVAVVLLTRSIDVDEAYQSVDWRILVLIFGMLGIGIAMQKTGAVATVIDLLVPWFSDMPPLVALAAVYVLTSVFTEMITNNAVAVLVTPIAIGLAHKLGVDPRPFVVAVMFAASASFATPVGYQTNTLVYSVGGYRFTDFLRIGLPMNVVVGVAAIFLIPVFWPF